MYCYFYCLQENLSEIGWGVLIELNEPSCSFSQLSVSKRNGQYDYNDDDGASSK